jgi:hypothetical protein
MQIFKGALKAFRTFPASIGSALAFSIVTMIRIQLDWPQQESLNFLFNCLHWSFALGAIFSLAAITAAQSRFHSQTKAFLVANLLGVTTIAVTFLLLYLLGSTQLPWLRYTVISPLAAARVSVAMLLSLIAFIILAGYPNDRSDFASSFFMTHKAFFIALIYGIVIMMGAFGVARAVQALLYHGMSSKVYMYISTLVGFISFTIFIGYFPDFRMEKVDKQRDAAQKKPRFIEILLVNILVPIVLALTAVLLIWAAKTAVSGMHASFLQLSIIAATYTIGGLWLHVMIAGYETGLAKLYRRIYPFSSLVILLFEGWAVLKQLQYSGLKLMEYSFILIWILALAGVLLLLTMKSEAHPKIAVLACVLAVICVLPVVGYYALPVSAQVSRLETLLVGEGMLKDNHLTPAASEPNSAVRIAITDAVLFLANAQDAKLPSWFNSNLDKSDVFKKVLGFEQTWPEQNPSYEPGPEEYLGTFLNRSPEAIDISAYHWAVSPLLEYSKAQGDLTISGNRGTYHVHWLTNTGEGVPSLQIQLDDRVVIEQDMNDYIDKLSQKYPPSQGKEDTAAADDMMLKLHSQEVDVLLVLRRVEMTVDPSHDVIKYWLDLDALYLNENP